jgi:hypothetical protein
VSDQQEELRDALKRATSTLKREGPPFALGGSYALWVHGGPEPVHDVDLVVAEEDADQAAAVLAAAGFDVERTPEDWLFKAHAGAAMVDVLHRFAGEPIGPEVLARATEEEVLGLRIPVLPATELLVVKLRSLSEHYCDFGALLPAVRAVREQVDWPRVREETADNHFAAVFLILGERLGILTPDQVG